MDHRAPTHLQQDAGAPGTVLERLRSATPLVQCLTNAVVTNFTANVLLAAGAAPAMVDVPGEAGDFARIASAVLVNLGTPHREQREAMMEAARAAHEYGTPWVLDPVAVGPLALRTDFAHLLLELNPAVIRGNASEIMALAGSGAGGRGVDSTDAVEAALPAARALSERTGAVVAVSGPVDLVTGPGGTLHVHGGSELLTRVTGGGCALGALVAACVASHGDPLQATAAAHAWYSAAAEDAAATAGGPGTFAPAFLDALAGTTPERLASAGAVR
ncbi:hydroxyethylthiazole kinase [Zafaria sp. Z1313]|uniref:hydroxyethylthiazole kinase n=1 Tax=unclassified Zafaria TaxID=2828765 RepID=UPI002E7AA2F6|nr:hydroxyethylthiazole kinase [Zafaria sp. J156]MEE1621432.1 hydroxyethylthiazole kinase [Zafaria sp. J156]